MFKELRTVNSGSREWIIIDDDFEYPINGGNDWVDFYSAFVEVYKKNGLNVAKNLALYVVWWAGAQSSNPYDNPYWQHDRKCSKRIKGWTKYAKKRDEYLKKMMVWK